MFAPGTIAGFGGFFRSLRNPEFINFTKFVIDRKGDVMKRFEPGLP